MTYEQETTPRKSAAGDFLRMVVAGHIDDAYAKYVDMAGKHHNLYFPAGFPSLCDAMKQDHAQHPNKIIIIHSLLEDGNLVAAHSHLRMHTADPGITVVHLFRFTADKISEMWDVAALIPAETPNTDGPM